MTTSRANDIAQPPQMRSVRCRETARNYLVKPDTPPPTDPPPPTTRPTDREGLFPELRSRANTARVITDAAAIMICAFRRAFPWREDELFHPCDGSSGRSSRMVTESSRSGLAKFGKTSRSPRMGGSPHLDDAAVRRKPDYLGPDSRR